VPSASVIAEHRGTDNLYCMMTERTTYPAAGEDDPPFALQQFSSLRSEKWEFKSSLTPNELRTRLNASWDEPFQVFGPGAWSLYKVRAVTLPDGWIFVRPLNDLYQGEFSITRKHFSRMTGQYFSGEISPTSDGSKLIGWARVRMFSGFNIMAAILIALGTSAAIGGGALFVLAMSGMLAVLAITSKIYRGRLRRAAIWKFLHAATTTPAGEELMDEIAEAVARNR